MRSIWGSLAALASTVIIHGDARIDYERLAHQVVAALRPARGERVILRSDPAPLSEFTAATRHALETAGAVVEVLSRAQVTDLAERLTQAQAYVSMPRSVSISAEESAEIERWLDAGKGRHLRLEWARGTRDEDDGPAPHSEALDRMYADAITIDSARLASQMDRAIARLRGRLIRVTTPQGTDVQFRVGDRPFIKQDGDGSAVRVQRARVLAEKTVDLPAGVLRVAPLEATIYGWVVVPRARLKDFTATDLRFLFSQGRALEAQCCKSAAGLLDPAAPPALRSFMEQYWDGVPFSEFALGFNDRLKQLPHDARVPYFGYGAGMVRLSVGDNRELGGRVHRGPVRAFYFPDATVTADGAVLVRNGALQ